MSYTVRFWDPSDFCFPCRTLPFPDFLKKAGIEEADWTELLGSLRSCRSLRENPFAFFFYAVCHLLWLGAAIHGANHRKVVEVITQAEDTFNQKCAKKLGLFVTRYAVCFCLDSFRLTLSPNPKPWRSGLPLTSSPQVYTLDPIVTRLADEVFVDWRSGELVLHPPPAETAAPVTVGASQPPREKSWYQAMAETLGLGIVLP